MAGKIPENILDDILSRVNIVEVVSGYIPLKRAGRNFRANCPFHHEKTPSFVVSPDRQIYHCFGCNAGGNAFNFLMQYERLEFPEAVEFLAKKAGVVLPQIQTQDSKAQNLITQIYKANELAVSFYSACLNSEAGGQAKQYLIKRGLKEETLKTFKLGFSRDTWDALIAHLRQKGLALGILEKAGLVLTKDGGGYYDRFRGRIIFPIFDIKDRAIGFGARVLDESLPKYLNSPETPIYTKGRNLFGLNLSREAIRENDFVAVVEGYLDFIMPYQEGFKNIVASLGTALTVEQARLLKRYTHNVVMVYDPDKAGELATLRTLDIFIEEEMNVKVVTLPEGADPDLFVRKNGAGVFMEKIAQAENLFDYKFKILKNRWGAKEIEAKARIASEMLLSINKFKNAVLKSEYTRQLAEELKLKEEALLEELKKIKPDKQYLDTSELPKRGRPLEINPTEKLLVKLMLEEADMLNYARSSLEPADFQDERIARIVALMFELVERGEAVEANKLMARFEGDELAHLICESTFMPGSEGIDKEKMMDACIKRVKNERLKSRKQKLHEDIKAAQASGDEKRLEALTQEFHNLIRKR